MTSTTNAADADRLYFRQLLSGRDFAVGDPVATQMVNFVYAIGDRTSGECVLVDPAYAVADLLDAVAADGMNVTGVIASHYHPDHIGGSMMGYTIEGVPALLEQVDVPIHVQRAEAPWVSRVIGIAEGELAIHEPGDAVTVGGIDVELLHTPGHTPGSQCLLVHGRLVSGDTLFLDGCGRTDLPGSDAEAMYDSLQTPRRAPRRHRRVPRPPLLTAVERDDVVDPRAELRVQAVVEAAVDVDVRQLTVRGREVWPPSNRYSTVAEFRAAIISDEFYRNGLKAQGGKLRADPVTDVVRRRPGQVIAVAAREICPVVHEGGPAAAQQAKDDQHNDERADGGVEGGVDSEDPEHCSGHCGRAYEGSRYRASATGTV